MTIKESALVIRAKLSNFSNSFKGKRKAIGAVLGALVIATSLGIGVYLVQNRQRTAVKASLIDLTLSSNNENPYIDNLFTIAIGINTNGMSATAADLRVNYDTNYLEAEKIEAIGDILPGVLIPGDIDLTTGEISIVLGPLIDQEGAHPKSGVDVLAQIRFKAKSEGLSSVTFGQHTAVTASGHTSNMTGNLTSIQITVLAPTPTPTANPTASPTEAPTPTPTPTPTATPSKIGDVDRDGNVDIVDLGLIIDNYMINPIINQAADLDENGIVDIIDIGLLIDNYGT